MRKQPRSRERQTTESRTRILTCRTKLRKSDQRAREQERERIANKKNCNSPSRHPVEHHKQRVVLRRAVVLGERIIDLSLEIDYLHFFRVLATGSSQWRSDSSVELSFLLGGTGHFSAYRITLRI